MKLAAAIAIGDVLGASPLALGAGAASGEERFVYRTVRLAYPQRPPSTGSSG